MGMSVREPLEFRKALLAGAVALTLTGTGVAFAWAAGGPTPSPPTSQSEPASGQDNRHARAGKAQRPDYLHSESVVKKADGTIQTILAQHGTVESVSATAITVKSEDGYAGTYAVNAETRIKGVPAAPATGSSVMLDGGNRLKKAAGTIADIAVGDVVRVSGLKNGDRMTAERIAEDAGDRQWPGPGRGHRHGHEHGHGHGKGAVQGRLLGDWRLIS
jgi:hypothetical protein